MPRHCDSRYSFNKSFCLCITAVYHAQEMCSAYSFTFMWVKLIFIWKVLHTDSFWNRGKTWPGNAGQFIFDIVLASVLWVTYAWPNETKQTSVGFCTLCYKHFMSIFRAANLKISRVVGEFDGYLPFELPTLRLYSKEERKTELSYPPCYFFVQPVVLTFTPFGE